MSNDPVQSAAQLVASGKVQDAAILLAAAGKQGSAPALVELAVWHLRGSPVRRDLAAARSLLRRAVAIGHVDAALMEIALTANGSGAPADWRGAVTLLEAAARADPLAAQQLALLRQMGLGADGQISALPQPEVLHKGPRIARYSGFCTAEQAGHIASLILHTLQPSVVVDPRTGRMTPHPIRTSDNAAIGPTQESLVVQAINRRIAAATGTDAGQGEALTVLRYAPGQQYRPHLDALPNTANQRILTAILYLNDGYVGGETEFPLLGIKVKARVGDLLVFENVGSDGSADPKARHAGLPVTQGVKWIATRWIRARPISLWEQSEAAREAIA